MRTGRLAISRGHVVGYGPEEVAPRAVLLPAPPKREPAAPREPLAVAAPEKSGLPVELLPDHELIDRRLSALERLTRLVEQGVLSNEEFADEKALILGRFAPRSGADGPIGFAPPATTPRPRGTSLLGRLLKLRLLPLGAAAGVAISWATQPAETRAFFEEALRLIGA